MHNRAQKGREQIAKVNAKAPQLVIIHQHLAIAVAHRGLSERGGHGLNALQAFEALRGFFRGGWYKGLRTVLIVPGRGRNSPDGVGVLRGKLQSWLTQDPFKRVVLAFCTAQPHDGGPGSVYVLLRKYRKKGRIYWERMPADEDLY